MNAWKNSLTPTASSSVHKDEIWKNQVSREARGRTGKWGYLNQLYRERFSATPPKPDSAASKAQTNSRGTVLPPLPLLGQPTQSHTPAMRRVQEMEAQKMHQEKRYNAHDEMKKGGGFPKTSSAEIGWRCKQNNFDQLAKRKKSLRKTLDWPRQEWPLPSHTP